MDRRAALKLLLAAAASCKRDGGVAAGIGDESSAMNETSPRRMPSTFLAHGSPFLLDDAKWVEELAGWARAMPRPRSILMLSAHWVDAPITLASTRAVPLVYDFYGFPQKYYDVKYAAPGAPDLAKRVEAILAGAGPVAKTERGLDHGAYVPLVAMYPEADVPVLQVSLPTLEPAPLFELGRALAPLRSEGVLIVGSGFLTHNMSTIQWGEGAQVPGWATEFDAWSKEALAKRDADALVGYRERAPGVRMALPTHEHFVPVLVATGASIDTSEAATFPVEGFTYGSFTKRSVQFG